MWSLARSDDTFGQKVGCGPVPIQGEYGQFGPFDYRDPDPARQKVMREISGTHFNADVENLVRGQTGAIGADISFLLHYFPNHHRALDAMARLSVRERTDPPRGAQYPVECYFDRAMKFSADDAIVRLLYAKFLSSKRQYDKAVSELQEAARLSPDNANVRYNLGLALAELKRYDEAAEQAQKAYELGFQLPGLRKKLESVGKWPPSGK